MLGDQLALVFGDLAGMQSFAQGHGGARLDGQDAGNADDGQSYELQRPAHVRTAPTTLGLGTALPVVAPPRCSARHNDRTAACLPLVVVRNGSCPLAVEQL